MSEPYQDGGKEGGREGVAGWMEVQGKLRGRRWQGGKLGKEEEEILWKVGWTRKEYVERLRLSSHERNDVSKYLCICFHLL